VIVTERVHVVFRASTCADDRALPQGEAPPWVVEVEANLAGVKLEAEYWLRHCHGFLVDSESGEDVGVVDDVALGSDHAAGSLSPPAGSAVTSRQSTLRTSRRSPRASGG
jgi:hypothetical protein